MSSFRLLNVTPKTRKRHPRTAKRSPSSQSFGGKHFNGKKKKNVIENSYSGTGTLPNSVLSSQKRHGPVRFNNFNRFRRPFLRRLMKSKRQSERRNLFVITDPNCCVFFFFFFFVQRFVNAETREIFFFFYHHKRNVIVSVVLLYSRCTYFFLFFLVRNLFIFKIDSCH